MKNLAIFFLFPFFGTAQTIDDSHELLWEIMGNGAKTSYLFGTMHTNDKRVYNLSDSTYIALDMVEVISLEVDMFSIFDRLDTRLEEVKLKYDRDGSPYTSNRNGTETTYGNEDGMPQPLDAYFQKYCYNSGKKFVPLETVEFQENLLTSKDFRLDWKRLGIESLLVDSEDLLQLYLAGDIYLLDNKVKRSMDVYTGLHDKLIVDRNFGMADKLDSLIQLNSVFCGIGAGHLAGGAGVINLLRRKGYSVRRVVASYNENESEAEKNVKGYRDYTYDNDSLGFHAVFPGKPIQKEDYFASKDKQFDLIYRDFGQGNTFEVEVYNRTNGPDSEPLSLEVLAEIHIASPAESSFEKIILDNGGEAYQGLGQTYSDGLHWVRVIMSEDIFIVIKAYGGNKFMNSPRAFRFFDKVWID
ncbi:MAG: TraB/GumN family protein [Crocinitomicaceae bacterium]|nr:TraB/GumN family protein [Crocinitomicaceae bacterium]